MIRMVKKYSYSFLFLCILLIGCGKSEESQVAIVAPPVAKPVVVKDLNPLDAVAEEKPVYVYSGDRFRDPFMEIGQSTAYQPDAIFSPEQAKVKAIIHSKHLKSAVVQVTGSGSYFIKGNKIFDVMGKTITGYSAKIFLNKVVITGEAEDVYTLKLREEEGFEEES